MRKTIATVVVLGIVWVGYVAWPIYDLLVLVRAMEARDVDTVTRPVYFDAVGVSLTNQVVAAYVRRTRIITSVRSRKVWLSVPWVQRASRVFPAHPVVAISASPDHPG
jgi:hypothetical protein